MKLGIKKESPLRIALLFIVFTTLSYLLRLPTKNALNLDEGCYLSVAMLFAKGNMIYRDVYEAKPPLFHTINAVEYLLFGSNVHIARLIVVFIASGTGIMIYSIAKNLCNYRMAILAGLFFATFSSSPRLDGFAVMTEPYVAFTSCIAIFFMVKSFSGEKWKRMSILSGVFLGCSMLIRLTGAILFIVIVVWLILVEKKYEKSFPKRVVWTIAGVSIPFLLIALFLILNNGFWDCIYWMLQPLHGFYSKAFVTLQQKGQWFIDVFKATLPLWFLSVYGVMRRNNRFTVLITAWMISLISTFHLGFFISFPHYYYEIIPVLCILGAKGVENIVNWFKKDYDTIRLLKHHSLKIRQTLLSLLIVLLILLSIGVSSSISVQKNVDLAQKYATSADLALVNEISEYIDHHTTHHNRIFVFETRWPKIGPYIYYVSERQPPIKNLFFFPPVMTNEDASYVISALDSENVPYVVLIGTPPPFLNAKKVYDNVLVKYEPVHTVTRDFAPYPWLQDQPVIIYVKVPWDEKSKIIDDFENFTEVPPGHFFIVSPPGNKVRVNYFATTAKQGNYALEVEYQFENNTKNRWFTVSKIFDEPQNWAIYRRAVLSFWVYGDNSGNLLWMDIVDNNGNSGRYTIRLDFKGWKQILLLVSHDFFIQPPWSQQPVDFSQIKRGISISVGAINKPISSGRIFFDDFRLYYIDEKELLEARS